MNLSRAQQHVLQQLKRTATNHHATQSVTQLATQTGLSRSTIVRIINDLEHYGVITRIHRTDPTDGAQLTNAYRINIP
jgi:DNA-binding MarR family transcriptional regulator